MPLAECKDLRDLVLPPNATGIDPAGSGRNFLRRLPNLERISYQSRQLGRAGWTPSQTAAEFWREWDEKKRSAASAERLRRATEVSGQKLDNSGQPPSSRPPASRDAGVPGKSGAYDEPGTSDGDMDAEDGGP
jgi:hypothetical protein